MNKLRLLLLQKPYKDFRLYFQDGQNESNSKLRIDSKSQSVAINNSMSQRIPINIFCWQQSIPLYRLKYYYSWRLRIASYYQQEGFTETHLSHMEGMILKKSPHRIQGWQQIWVECSDNRLVYYLPDNRNTPFGIIDFNIMTYSIQRIIDQHGNLIEFVTQWFQKNFIFKAKTSLETQKWFNAVSECWKDSEGAKRILQSLNKYPKFWRTDRISYEQFSKVGEAGDILLFRGRGINCQIQRGLTGSEYDHAAILLRFQSGPLYMLEATGYFGVGLCSWKDIIENRWFELYEKIMIRRLDIDRDHQFIRTVQEFVNENMGKKYQFQPIQMLKNNRSVQQINNQTNRQQRTFFCSEMIVALYKKLGIFDQRNSFGPFLPGDLSSLNRGFNVLEGKLHPEQLIDFSDI